MNYKSYFKGKRITIMGLGLLGRGLNDAIFLAKQGAILTITDLRDKKTLKPSLEKLKSCKKITYTLGEHKLEDFENKDFILKAAGVPLDSPFIAHAKKRGIPIDGRLAFAKLAEGVHVIGITGTRGKTTTTNLIFEIIKKAYSKKSEKVYLGGNIRDMATLPLIAKVKPGDFVVLELDSWQLQGFGDAKISPHISIFTNFLEDHQNYYKNNQEQYFEDKAQIFLNQKQNDYLVSTSKVSHLITAKYFGKLFHDPILASKEDIPPAWKLQIVGDHNRENAALALQVARILNIPDHVTREAMEKFKGVTGRLEFVKKTKKGVEIWNDNNSTTPDATIAALRALVKEKKVILIAGGSDKKLDLTLLVGEIENFCKALVLLSGAGSEKFKEAFKLKSTKANKLIEAKTLKEAVDKALKLCNKDDILLFSPAFASFGMFKNEYDRGDQFLKIVKSL